MALEHYLHVANRRFQKIWAVLQLNYCPGILRHSVRDKNDICH